MRLWHYTFIQSFYNMTQDGVIKTSSTVRISEMEKPVIWLSSNPVWEETVRKALRDPETGEISEALSRDELFQRGYPAVRIKTNSELVAVRSWRHFKKYSGIPKKEAKALAQVALKWGANPKEWWVSYEDIPLTSCLLPIEIWNGSKWIDIDQVNLCSN